MLERQAQHLHLNHQQFVTVYTGPSVVREGMIEPQNIPYEPWEVFDNVISGSPEEAAEKIAQYRDLGIKHLCVNMSFGGGHQEVLDSMKLFANQVMPHFPD